MRWEESRGDHKNTPRKTLRMAVPSDDTFHDKNPGIDEIDHDNEREAERIVVSELSMYGVSFNNIQDILRALKTQGITFRRQ